jgi:hypothetical protein
MLFSLPVNYLKDLRDFGLDKGIPLLANEIWRNFLLLSRRGSDRTGLKRRKDATSHIILDNLYCSHCHKRIQHPNVKKFSKPRTLQDTFNDLLVMTWLIEMIIQNPVFGISCIISMLVHSTSQCLTSFTNIQKSTECTFYVVNDIFSRTVERVKQFGVVSSEAHCALHTKKCLCPRFYTPIKLQKNEFNSYHYI